MTTNTALASDEFNRATTAMLDALKVIINLPLDDMLTYIENAEKRNDDNGVERDEKHGYNMRMLARAASASVFVRKTVKELRGDKLA